MIKIWLWVGLWLDQVLLPVAATSVYNHGERVSGAILHYEFSHTECLGGTFFDSSEPALFGNLSIRSGAVSCNDGLGVSLFNHSEAGAAKVVSTAASSSFLAALDSSAELTVEFWKESANNHHDYSTVQVPTSANLPIITIGQLVDGTENTCSSTASQITYSLQAIETFTDEDQVNFW